MAAAWWQIEWVWQVTGWLLCALGVVVMVWALFWDRARGRRRCPGCWYDMSGAVATAREGQEIWVCPECGRVVERERQFSKTRRRWRLAGAACLILILGAASLASVVYRNGWWSLVPTKVLVDVYPLSGPTGLFGGELLRRLGYTFAPRTWSRAAAIATDGDKRYLLRRIRYGNVFAGQGSSWWRESYGELPHGLPFVFDLGFAPEKTWPGIPSTMAPVLVNDLKRLYELPLDVRFAVRKPWPTDSLLFVGVDAVNPWPWPTGDYVVIKRKDTGAKMFEGASGGFLVKEPPKSGVLELELEVFQVKQSEPNSEWISVERRSVSVPIQISGTTADQLTLIFDKAVDALVAGITYQVGAGVSTDVTSTQQRLTRGIAFGVIMEHRLAGKTLCRERAWWMGGETNPMGRYIQREWIDGSLSAWSAKAGEKWTIHIVGDRETALRVIGPKQYWGGEADIDVINYSQKP